MPQFRLYAKYAHISWIPEFFAIILSCGLMVALCDILAVYNERETPTFGVLQDWGLTLNTVVSILANVSVFSATAAVASCIGQLKWLYFAQSSRPLGDFEIYDEASRGLMGSIQLLWKLRMTPTASLGALLVILQISIAPLAQQSVQTRIGTVILPHADANCPWARTWDRLLEAPISLRFPSNIKYSIPLGMRGAILGGLIANSSLLLNNTVPSCASGNCAFGDYSSLAVCPSVQDVSDHIQDFTSVTSAGQVGRVCVKDHACLILDGDSAIANSTSAAPENEFYKEIDTSRNPSLGRLNFTSIAFKNHSNPIADGFIIYKENSYLLDFNALEFVFDWCIIKFSTNVTNGTAATIQQKKPLMEFQFEDNYRQLTRSNGYHSFQVDSNAHYALQRYMGMLLSGAIVLKESTNTTLRNFDNSDEIMVIGRALGVEGLERDDNDSGSGVSTLQTVLRNIAMSMTNYIRIESTDYMNGDVYVERSFVVVQWGWLVAPITFVALSAIFFIAVVVQGGQHKSAGLPLWKSNSMAALRVLDPKLRSSIGPLDLVSSLEDEENQLRACLVRDDVGWVLTQEETSEDGPNFVPVNLEDQNPDDAISEVSSLTLQASESNPIFTPRPVSNISNCEIETVASDISHGNAD